VLHSVALDSVLSSEDQAVNLGMVRSGLDISIACGLASDLTATCLSRRARLGILHLNKVSGHGTP
jgi:hypothetical protein